MDIPGEIIFDGIMTVGAAQNFTGYSLNRMFLNDMGELVPSTTIYGEDIKAILNEYIHQVNLIMLNRRGMSAKPLFLNLYSPEGITYSLKSYSSYEPYGDPGYWGWLFNLPANTIRPVGSKWRVVMAMDK